MGSDIGCYAIQIGELMVGTIITNAKMDKTTLCKVAQTVRPERVLGIQQTFS